MNDSLIQQLTIVSIIPETNDAKTFVLEPLNGWKPVYEAGQFITLVFYTKHGERRRSYSISSSPLWDEPLMITIKRVENGEFSRLLLSHAKEGDILFSSGINGFFKLPEDIASVQQYFFIAAGSGITPCYSLIKTLLRSTEIPIVLIYSNRSEEDAIFLQSLLTLKEEFTTQFSLYLLFTNSGNVLTQRLSNWLLQQLLDKFLVAPKGNVLAYVCGPFDYMRTVNITLLNEHFPAANIKKENFNTLPRVLKPVPPDTEPHIVTIHINQHTYHLSVQFPHSILAAAKMQHIELPYSCEAGRCGSCAATCTKGQVWMAYNEVLLDEEIKKGRVLTCQGYPINGDVEINF